LWLRPLLCLLCLLCPLLRLLLLHLRLRLLLRL
jgi:hypothetical protein